jgi:hypothetical protein
MGIFCIMCTTDESNEKTTLLTSAGLVSQGLIPPGLPSSYVDFLHRRLENQLGVVSGTTGPALTVEQLSARLSLYRNPTIPQVHGLTPLSSATPTLGVTHPGLPAGFPLLTQAEVTCLLANQLCPRQPSSALHPSTRHASRGYFQAQLVQRILNANSNTNAHLVSGPKRESGMTHNAVSRPAVSRPQTNARSTLPALEQGAVERVVERTSHSVTLSVPSDVGKLSSQQVWLRHQIEAFAATPEHLTTHTRGRTKAVQLGQVGIRCRHCAHLPLISHHKGSTYFPTTVQGFYQAAQNMSSMHLQPGKCQAMPESVKSEFESLLTTKGGCSGAGRVYWTDSARELGLVDTDQGIYFKEKVPRHAHIVEDSPTYKSHCLRSLQESKRPNHGLDATSASRKRMRT